MPWVLLLLVNVAEMMPTGAAEPPVARPGKPGLEFILVSKEGRHFVLSSSGSEFRPWGFNYDHDAANRLLETYWKEDWKAVAGDFEEMFPLACSLAELDQFIDGSKPLAVGWIGFYWGKTIAEYQQGQAIIADSITREWLEYFVRKTPAILNRETAVAR
jgi:hypothetical protein